jgi:predicted deacylase
MRWFVLLCSTAALAAPQAADPDAANGPYPGFITWQAMKSKISGWARRYPKLVTVSVLGKTALGRDIPLLRLGSGKKPNAPEVLLIGGVHPREQSPLNALASLTEEMLSKYGTDARFTALLDERTVWLIPVLNVDGKVHDFAHGNGTTRGADWRKNRRRLTDGNIGVDLNRNWPVRWGGNREIDTLWRTSTTVTKDDIYEGDAPLSEPENRALAAFLERRPIRAFLDLHCPLKTILFPAYAPAGEMERILSVAKAMRAAQADPYPLGAQHPDADPPAQRRDGNTGLTYTWAFYTQGAYGFNFEIGFPNRPTGIAARYYPPEKAAEEYQSNVREPLLQFLERGSTLPPRRDDGEVKLLGSTADMPPTPDAVVQWTPRLSGSAKYAVLVSKSPDAVVQSEFRMLPLRSGYTLHLQPKVKPGTALPLVLYVWDADRRRTVIETTLRVQQPQTQKNSPGDTPRGVRAASTAFR